MNKVAEVERTKTREMESTISAVVFSMESLTSLEQLIFIGLYEEASAVNAWQIYRRVLALMAKTPPSVLKPVNPTKIPNWTPAYWPPVDKKGVSAFVVAQKKYGVKMPDYGKLVRILKDMSAFGWVKAREAGVGNAKALYFLSNDTREVVKKYMDAH